MSLLHSVVAWVRGWHESNFGMGGMGGKDQNSGVDAVGPQIFTLVEVLVWFKKQTAKI